MSDVDESFTRATDSLISLYRTIELRTLDLPVVSFMPLLIGAWSSIKFAFFLDVGIFLIIPVNIVILIRNIFPGHWRYRPFFLRHLRYAWLWIWRGEAPTLPLIFIRPVMIIFMKHHFERRLTRLRLEVQLRDGLSDSTRSALVTRIDAAVERWKLPQFRAVFITVLLPGLFSIPAWYKGFIDFLQSFHVPTDIIVKFFSALSFDTAMALGFVGFAYLLTVTTTNFLAKRGLFIGAPTKRICFPGGQEGSGCYSKEREILATIDLRIREVPLDLWLLTVYLVIWGLIAVLYFDQYMASFMSGYVELLHSQGVLGPGAEGQLLRQMEAQMQFQRGAQFVSVAIYFGLLALAALRRKRGDRA
jgi:hypothetical protein